MLVATKIVFLFVAVCVCAAAFAADDRTGGGRRGYPPARVEPVVNRLHGVDVSDPYRWLEASESAEVREWIAAQNQFCRAALDGLPGRAAIHRRLGELLSVGTISAPAVRGRRYFYTKRDGKQNQPILLARDGVRGDDRVLIDPNTLSADGTVALDWWSPSRDGRRLAYGTSESGSEKSTLRVLDVETGTLLGDTIPFTRACSVAWQPDGSGFYYTRYPTPGSVPAGEENYHRHVFFHSLGTDAAGDPEIFGRGRAPSDWPNLDVSPDGRWLVVNVHQGWSKSEVYLRDLSRPDGEFVAVVEGVDALFNGDMQNDRLYLHTNWGAPRYRVFAVDPKHSARDAWRELIGERDSVLENIAVIGGRLVAHSLRDASSCLETFSLDGKLERAIEMPTLGTLSGLGGEWDGDEGFFGFTSFAVPPAVYRIGLEANRPASESQLWEQVTAPIEPSQFAIQRVRAKSRDGTAVPMFLLHRTGLKIDGNCPTVLYGYGGFNNSLTPTFYANLPLWLERGGVFVVANLRGGGEFGEGWHQAGMLGNKQNVFDDFIAAAEWLIENRFTNRDRLAISGGSNGGLLVGAALTQRPDLFRAVVCRVPLLDMIRYHQFRIAKLWIPEYGSSDDPEQFQWLRAYSPYHRVRDGASYPAVLLTTAESDSRVDPMHALKMAARLQAASSSDRPILLRVESKAGHGAGKPLAKTVEEQTDVWSFLCWQLGVEP